MPIEKNKVVTLHYTLFNADDDREVERSGDHAPLIYLHGAGNILAALEQALHGKEEGDAVTVTLDARDAYGERDEKLFQRLSAKYLKHAGKLTPGKVVRVQTEQGPRMVTIVKAGLKTVDVDANHPLAGQRLRFEMTVASVRDASAEEIAHRHVHGPGGHQH
ncbi:FKBP-type peptidyl-prolyl cis-trans isomerase [Alloalcanivorax mobilis]|uniref:FKBP-type peptidyl-prolyl cis-trans isomerase n=1 Tax=Alloalcanivorax mobilis TaxID=2019569 RepID=UPI000B5B41DC|nr:peptidylprolyl isomerase [Alloalcanivorax mobilis]ASK35858.1 peptidylprolyl isomerase [Alcanivorax sp. N3-2A]|tara:strand:- start:1744 stop:2229 length:486 start_codon:yes stop_codon:yes gene_type:complete